MKDVESEDTREPPKTTNDDGQNEGGIRTRDYIIITAWYFDESEDSLHDVGYYIIDNPVVEQNNMRVLHISE